MSYHTKFQVSNFLSPKGTGAFTETYQVVGIEAVSVTQINKVEMAPTVPECVWYEAESPAPFAVIVVTRGIGTLSSRDGVRAHHGN